MTFSAISRNWLLSLSAIGLLALPASSQITLTGAVQFSTDSAGGASGGQIWSTNPVSGNCCYALWLASNPDATSPINGPSDAQAGISIPLQAGYSYTYYTFNQPGASTFSFNGLSLFFNGNNSTPAISAFGALNSSVFQPDSGNTYTLQGGSVAGAGTTVYNSGNIIVALTGYTSNMPRTLDACQAYVFAPGNGPDYYGSFTLQVFSAATLSLSRTSAPPGAYLTLTGSGFAPLETVNINFGAIGIRPRVTATADATGAFTANAFEPQAPYGPESVYALGQTSGKLGTASLFVTPALAISPPIATPDSTAAAEGVGFGAGEAVNVYWGMRQFLGTAIANGAGSFIGDHALQITIPISAHIGTDVVTAVGQTTGATATGKVFVK